MSNSDGKKWTVALCGGGSSAHILVAMAGLQPNMDVRAWVMESELGASGAPDELAVRGLRTGRGQKLPSDCRGTASMNPDPAKVDSRGRCGHFCGPISIYPSWMKGIAPVPAVKTRNRWRLVPARYSPPRDGQETELS